MLLGDLAAALVQALAMLSHINNGVRNELAAARAQVLAMLSHINKRVKGHKDIRLPLEALVAIFNEQQPPASPIVRNFAVVYVEMAAERATPTQQLAIVRFSSSGAVIAHH
jgi:hypothetical protein